MKFTNKDAKVRMYDGTGDSSGGATVFTVGSAGIGTITVTPDPTWTANEWKHQKVHMLTGAAADKVYEVFSNDTDTVTVNGIPTIDGVLAGDTFNFGEPWYFEMCLDSGDFSGPIGAPKLDEILVLDRGLVSPCAHYITSNAAPVMEPVDISFSVIINDSSKFLSFMDWIEGGLVNGHTTLTTKGHSERFVTTADLQFADDTKKCFDVEYKLTGTTNNISYIFRECYFDLMAQTYSEAEDGVTLSLTGKCYGRILRLDGFTDGTNVLA